MVAQYDGVSNKTAYVFDQRNRQVKVVDRLSGTVEYAYDRNNRMTTMEDQDGSVTTFYQDPRGLLAAKVLPLGQYADRDLNGTDTRTSDRWCTGTMRPRALRKRLDQSGVLTRYSHDMANRLLGAAYPDNLNDVFAYDDAGRQVVALSGRYSNAVSRVYGDAGNF